MGRLRAWRRRRLLRSHPIAPERFERALAELPLLTGLGADERQCLRDFAVLFLHEKSLEGAADLEISPDMALRIALQACLPVLHLGIDWLAGWVSLVVYPDEFLVDHEAADEAGVVHRIREARSGESWERGPLILAWADVAAGTVLDGYNVVLHEVAHKLDALNGIADGFPPLHRGMDVREWTAAFSAAFEALGALERAGEACPIDPYAAEAPEEFFAVASEYFFELPDVLVDAYPAVYEQLRLFYRQDPLRRLDGIPSAEKRFESRDTWE